MNPTPSLERADLARRIASRAIRRLARLPLRWQLLAAPALSILVVGVASLGFMSATHGLAAASALAALLLLALPAVWALGRSLEAHMRALAELGREAGVQHMRRKGDEVVRLGQVVHAFGESLRRQHEGERALALANAELRAAREQLERRVRERTAELAVTAGELRQTVSALEDEIVRRERSERDLCQAQKLEAVGRLAAGVAHEINTPVQFVSDNCHFVRDAIADLRDLVGQYRALLRDIAAGTLEAQQGLVLLQEAEEAADADFLFQNVPQAIESALEGLQRIAVIVRSLKEFARPDLNGRDTADLNRAIQSTLTVASSEYRDVADVVTDLADIPPVYCNPGEIKQVLLNLIVNAAHAIDDKLRSTGLRGRITVRTSREGDQVVIAVGDTGTGIPEGVRHQVFDPFFSTKAVGQGAGQGLAIAHAVIVEKHQGSLSFDTVPGEGTTFTIRLPIGTVQSASDACPA